MRSLLQFLALCAMVSFCVCYESHESTESIEDVFVPPRDANSFFSTQRGNIHNLPRGNGFPNFRRMRKSPVEMRAEICEEYSPCRQYAYSSGYEKAFMRFFGTQNQRQRPQRPAGTRRY
ncbi:matrix Gla protein [Toxotes jaculatrix]|uniref:matrix Gla protein n=1 Tax=Toxotes jaculatrix TaxID=941984 RepID=UPI001B3AF7F0|nr:matrix Gla protein [Toxotes jaculatrix]XP_040919278.1 matrix Gla protein [Toxotes jaculatrix]